MQKESKEFEKLYIGSNTQGQTRWEDTKEKLFKTLQHGRRKKEKIYKKRTTLKGNFKEFPQVL